MGYLTVGLVFAWFFLNFATFNNANLDDRDLVIVGAAFGGAFAITGGVLFILARLVAAPAMVRCHLAAAMAVVIFFSFQPIMIFFEEVVRLLGLGFAPHYLYGATFVLLPILVLVVARGTIVTRLALVFAAVVTATAAVEFAATRLGEDDIAATRAAETPATLDTVPGKADAGRAGGGHPNVYHVVVDGYGEVGQLKSLFAYDNQAFLDALAGRGFALPSKPMANYPKTVLSLAATFNMDYPVVETDTYSSNVRFFDILGGRNTLVRRYLERGYKYIHLGSSMWGGSECADDPNIVCLTPNTAPVRDRTLEALNAVNFMTPISYFLSLRATRGAITTVDHARKAIAGAGINSSFYLFAHTLPPHSPYIFKADCSPQSAVQLNLSGGLDRDRYLDSLQCVNRQLLAFADFVAKTDPDAIVLFHSDHGSRFLTDWVRPISSWTRQQFLERFRIFVAVKAPKRCLESLYDGISLINVSRFVAACADGRKPDYIEDRHYIATDSQWPDYGRVFRYPYPKSAD
jgi:hypothetical protein